MSTRQHIPGPVAEAIVDHLMAAAVLRRFDQDVAIEHLPVPVPGPGEVAIQVAAAGISFVDALTTRGLYQLRPDCPWIPGSECAGTILAVGDGVQGWRVGERVCARGWGGMFAAVACVGAGNVARLPDGMGFDQGAVIRVAYVTALHALQDRAALQPGELLLVLGGGGSTGQAAIQIGKALGARVIAAASSPGRREQALAAGADHAVAGAPGELHDAAAALCGRHAVDVVFDPVGGDASAAAFRLLAWGGRHCVIGFATGVIASLRMNRALLQGASLVGVNAGRFTDLYPERAGAHLERVFRYFGAGAVTPSVAHRFQLADAAAALRLAAEGARGRIVLQP